MDTSSGLHVCVYYIILVYRSGNIFTGYTAHMNQSRNFPGDFQYNYIYIPHDALYKISGFYVMYKLNSLSQLVCVILSKLLDLG